MATGCGTCQRYYVPYVYPSLGARGGYDIKNLTDTMDSLRKAYPFPAGIPFDTRPGMKTNFGGKHVLPLILQSWLVNQFGPDWWCADAPTPPPAGAPGVLQQNLYTALSQSTALALYDLDSVVIVENQAGKTSPIAIPLGSHSVGTFNARRSLYKDTSVVITLEGNGQPETPGLQARISGITPPVPPVPLDGLNIEVSTNLGHFRTAKDPPISSYGHWYGLVPPDKSLAAAATSWKVYARLKSFDGTLPISRAAGADSATVHAYTDGDIKEITGANPISAPRRAALQEAYVRPRVSWPKDETESRLVPRYRVGSSGQTGVDEATINQKISEICAPARPTEAESVCNCDVQTYAMPYGAGRDAYTRYFTLVQTKDNPNEASQVFAPGCAGYCNNNPRATPFATGVAYPSATSRAKSACPEVEICKTDIDIRDAQVSKINIQAACNQIASRGAQP